MFCLIPSTGSSNPALVTGIFSSAIPINWDITIYKLTNQIQIGKTEYILKELEIIASMIEKSEDAVTDSYIFLQRFIDKMNDHFGASLTVPQILQLTKETILRCPIPNYEIDKYFWGLDLIENEISGISCHKNSGYLNLIRHEKNNNFWTWLSVATVTAGAVVVCIFCPGASTEVIKGAVKIGETLINNQK